MAMPVTLVRKSSSRQPVKETVLDAPLNTSIQSLKRQPSASRGSEELEASTSLMTGWSATARAAESKEGGLVTVRWPLSATHKASPLPTRSGRPSPSTSPVARKRADRSEERRVGKE